MTKNDFNTTLEKIKSRGFWKINFYPTSINTSLIDKPVKGKEIIRNASFDLRGWDYPHYPTRIDENEDVYIKNDRVESWIDWEYHKEIWRIYQSGQFIHLLALEEDWFADSTLFTDGHYLKRIIPGSILDIIEIIFILTQVFIFLRNLFENGLYQDALVVNINLFNTEDRVLKILESRRTPLLSEYMCRGSKVLLKKKTYTKEEIVNKYLEYASETIIELFHQFNWDNPPISLIKEEQNRLLERRP